MKSPRPILIFAGTILLLLILLFGRLFFLQILHREEYTIAAEQNRSRLVSSVAIRGTIYDRNMDVVAKDNPTYTVQIIPEELKEAILPRLSQILGMPVEEIQAKLVENKLPAWDPMPLRTGLAEEVVQKIAEQHLQLPGVITQIEPERFYPYANLFSHLIGYTGAISAEELAGLESEGYTGGDNIGKIGLEKAYEKTLRGQKGKQIIEVNAIGQPIRVLQEIEQVPGKDLILTVDLKLQQKARQILVDNKMNGAIVCLSPQTGEILAMVSSPDFDPNSFVKGIQPKEYQALLDARAFTAKTTQDRFPPGSTFKVVTTIAALEEGVIDPETYYVDCNGFVEVGGRRFNCVGVHGRQDLVEAIANSCNSFFYTLALEVGPEKIAKWAGILGLEEVTGVDLADEVHGVIPNPAWKAQFTDEPWYPGDTLNMGVGQGDVLVTPLGLAMVYATLANGGTLYQPHLVREIRTFDGLPVQTVVPTLKREIPLSQRTLALIREGMIRATDRGTTQQIKLNGISVAAKTGTAQITGEKQDIWIAAYAPVEKPEIVVLLMDEYSKIPYGSYLAPFAHDLLDVYFAGKTGVTP
ncbi:MAG: penicillin-binding protein 2 [bacterium]